MAARGRSSTSRLLGSEARKFLEDVKFFRYFGSEKRYLVPRVVGGGSFVLGLALYVNKRFFGEEPDEKNVDTQQCGRSRLYTTSFSPCWRGRHRAVYLTDWGEPAQHGSLIGRRRATNSVRMTGDVVTLHWDRCVLRNGREGVARQTQ